MNSAIQQYVPDIAHINGANADSIVGAVNSLRGFYGVSSNDVFVSGLDTTITAFLARETAASGPTLVTAFGLLAVALAATAFAALQFMDGHAAQVALWRARGWSRLRVWRLYCIEFATLAVVAVPPAIVATAAISSAAAPSIYPHPGLGWQRLADAAGPSVIASAAFLVILAGLAATRSGPELTQRRADRSATQRRSWRRRAVDAGLAAAAIGALVLARAGSDTLASASAPNNGGLVLALPVLAAGMLAVACLRLVGLTARVLTASRGVATRLARWQLERDPAQVARLCLLVTLAVTVGVFASTYTASDRASAIDRADYMVGADMRATFSSAASPPQLSRLTAALPAGVQAAQVFRGVGRPGRTGTDATLVGIQGPDFWNIAYARDDFAAQPLPTLASIMASRDPDGSVVPGTPRALAVSVYSSGFDGRVDIEITDATGRDTVMPMGTLGVAGWADLSAPLVTHGAPIAFPVRVRSLRVVPTGSNAVGDVAVENLRTDSGTV
ncbi:MAG TPA: hypothetical protein VLT58_05410, partial [Polyangia bacterium]|nr:hypothetical protein [Polyangia bacterium]